MNNFVFALEKFLILVLVIIIIIFSIYASKVQDPLGATRGQVCRANQQVLLVNNPLIS